MKTPEEYLPRSEPTLRKFKDGTEDIIYVPRYVAINSLKSMQEDAEKELIEFGQHVIDTKVAEYNQNRKFAGSNKFVAHATLPEMLTQFRNKQQGR